MHELKVLGHLNLDTSCEFSFNYQGLSFSQSSFQLFPGLCAVDNQQNVVSVFSELQKLKIQCARMGAYKPRTSPYSFQGLREQCLSYVFEQAGKHDIRIIAMEVMHERHIDAIYKHLQLSGFATGVMLQVGTRNTQNYELLKAIGAQNNFPVLFKRGFGISLNESLQAAEYIAAAGNDNIIFCLRGIKPSLDHQHRNFVDFSQVPIVKRLVKIPVGIDPSHAVGNLVKSSDGITDLFHSCAQGIISGANLALVDIHPTPNKALVDSEQALNFKQLETLLLDIEITRKAYLSRLENQGV